MAGVEMFTNVYTKHLKDLSEAERVYKVAPNRFTKEAFEKLKNKTFTYRERFTPEYIREYQETKKASQIEADNEMRHLFNALHIEDLFDSNKIDEDKRMYLHNKNDNKFNFNFFNYGNNY